MNNQVTVLMYHYVRDLKNTRYPNINGLDLYDFNKQIKYLKKLYTFITMENLVDSIYNKIDLPKKSILLTFDHGYSDHYNNVFPILQNNNIQGTFFIPAKLINEKSVLDVNKIHFILSTQKESKDLIKFIFQCLNENRSEYGLHSNEYYFNKLAMPNRFDTGEVIFIKRLLQHELNPNLRSQILTKLFEKFIGISESIFANELYLSLDQIKLMKKSGMHIGAHGFNHLWLGNLSREDQELELIHSKNFLDEIGVDENYRTLSYPYGSYDENTINLAESNKFKVAFTTVVDVAKPDLQNCYKIPRLDTNDLPIEENSSINIWYNKIQ